ncbi:hypothetical protein [Chryseolinea sp. H1M3-3]|uniref:hypothetical protein n=1 Tax=Chryseolinea sp. H1M3-3 TaxID=3034144 RepID=UPI0023EC3802|nr:hypothetical protein [Chryseolinea sp. H1M3-3]
MRKLHILLFWLLSAESYAQLEVSAGAGVGWFSMRELGELQKAIQSSYPVDAKITEEFPAYVIYDAEIVWKVNSSGFLGLYYQYGSTGGRTHYEDFSGEVYSDQLLHYNTLALSVAQELTFENDLQFRFDVHPGATFTNLKIIEGSRIGDVSHRESYKFHSINATLQPTLELQKTWGQFGIKAHAGFHFAVYAGKLKFNENKQNYLTVGNDPVVANWNGFRLGLTGTYRIRE